MRVLLLAGVALAALAIVISAGVGYDALNDRSAITPEAITALDRAQHHVAALGEAAPLAGQDIDGREQIAQSMFVDVDGLVLADSTLRTGIDALPPSFLRRLPDAVEIEDLTIATQSLTDAEPGSAESALLQADIAARADGLGGRLALVEGAAIRRQANLDDRIELAFVGVVVSILLAAALCVGLWLTRRASAPQKATAPHPAAHEPPPPVPSRIDRNTLVVDSDGHVRGLGADERARLASCVHPDDLDAVVALIDGDAATTTVRMRWWHVQEWRPILATVADRSMSSTTLVVIELSDEESGPRPESHASARASTLSLAALDPMTLLSDEHSADTDPGSVAHDLRAAIDGGADLELEFRPVVPVDGGSLRCLLADVVWHPRGAEATKIGPEALARRAEVAGMAPRLSIWAIEHGARAARRLHDEGLDAPVVVQISPSLLLRPDLVDRIADLLSESELPAGALMISVSQNAMIASPSLTAEQLAHIRDLGVGVMIVDVDIVSIRQGLFDRAAVDVIAIDDRCITRAVESADVATIAEIVARVANQDTAVAALNLETTAAQRAAMAGGVTLAAGSTVAAPIVLSDLVNV